MAGIIGTVGLSLLGGALSSLTGKQGSLATKLLAGKGKNILGTIAGIAGSVLTAIGNDDDKRVTPYGAASAAGYALMLNQQSALVGGSVSLEVDAGYWQTITRADARKKVLAALDSIRDDSTRWLAAISTADDELKAAEISAAVTRVGPHAGVLDDMTNNLHEGHLSTMTPDDDAEHKALQADYTARMKRLFKAMRSVRSTTQLPFGADEPLPIGKMQYCGGPQSPDTRFVQYLPDAYPEAPYVGFDGLYHMPPSVVLLPGINAPLNSDVLLTAGGSTQFLTNGTLNDAFEAGEKAFFEHLQSMVGSPLLRTNLKFSGSVGQASTIISASALTQWGAAKQSDRSGRPALLGSWQSTTRSGKLVTRNTGMWRVIMFGMQAFRTRVTQLQVMFSGGTRILQPSLVSPNRTLTTTQPDFTADSFLTAPQAVLLMVRVPGGGGKRSPEVLAMIASGMDVEVLAAWNQDYHLQKGGASGGNNDDLGGFFPTCDRQVNVWESEVNGVGATIDATDCVVLLEFVNPVGPNMLTSHAAKNVLYMPATGRPTFTPYAQWSFGPRSYGSGTQPNPVFCIDDVVPGGMTVTQFLTPGVDDFIAGPKRVLSSQALDNGGSVEG